MPVKMSKAKAAARTKKKGRFVKAPPEKAMRRKNPISAPRLYEWLVDNGYVERVTTYRRKSANRRRR